MSLAEEIIEIQKKKLETMRELRDSMKEWNENYDRLRKDVAMAKKFKEIKEQEDKEKENNVEPRREKLEDEKK